MDKTCTSCHVSKPLGDYSFRNKNPVAWCKVCVAEKTKRWYTKNREKALLSSKKWVANNRRKSNGYKKKWVQKHKEYRNEWLKEYRKKYPEIYKNYSKKYRDNNKQKIYDIQKSYMNRKKLNIWLQEVGKPIVKSTVARDCEVCGMPSMKCDLYIFDDRYTCSECLRDFKDTCQAKRIILLAKVECPKCGREHPDRRFKNVCVDCRILEKQKMRKNYYSV